MKKAGIIVMSLTAIMFATHSYAREMDEVDEIRREIAILNLINGLNLSDAQSEEILKYAVEAKRLTDSAKAEYEMFKGELKDSLIKLKESLYDNEARPMQEIERNAAKLDHRVKERKDDAIRELKGIEEKVKAVLTPGQIEIIEGFKPCLIPPKDLKNPVRAGQAFDSSHMERLLEKVREMPTARFETARYRLVDEYTKKMESNMGGMNEAEKNKKKWAILDTMETARKISDEEFAISKKELAQKINPETEKDKFAGEERRKKGLGQIGRFLLDEKVIPVLQGKIEGAKGQGNTGSLGLANVKEDFKNKVCKVNIK